MRKEVKKERKNAIRHNSKNITGRIIGYHLSTATRALMIGVTVIIVCIVCSLALNLSNHGKTAINTGTSQYNRILENYQDLDIAMYDGSVVYGQEVTALIRNWKLQKDTLAIRVKTKASNNYVYYNNYCGELEGDENGETTSTDASAGTEGLVQENLIEDKADDNYINPQALFFGTVWKNANGVIICVDFVQQ